MISLLNYEKLTETTRCYNRLTDVCIVGNNSEYDENYRFPLRNHSGMCLELSSTGKSKLQKKECAKDRNSSNDLIANLATATRND